MVQRISVVFQELLSAVKRIQIDANKNWADLSYAMGRIFLVQSSLTRDNIEYNYVQAPRRLLGRAESFDSATGVLLWASSRSSRPRFVSISN